MGSANVSRYCHHCTRARHTEKANTVVFTHYQHDKMSVYMTVAAPNYYLALKCFPTDMYIMLCMNISFMNSSESQSCSVKREM